MAKSKLDLPLGPIPDLLKWWKKAGVKGIVIGGLAVAIHTRARSTKDVDAVILLEGDAWAGFLELGKSFSFLGRYSDTLAFARSDVVRMLTDFNAIDYTYIRSHLTTFASILDDPGLSSSVDDLLIESRRDKRP